MSATGLILGINNVYDDMNELTLFKFVSDDDKIYVEQDFKRRPLSGMPLTNFILKERLGRVKELLVQTNM